MTTIQTRPYKSIKEDTEVVFKQYDQLSYIDASVDIELYVDDEYVGNAEVWADNEEEGREYICLNYEIVYLDTIKKIK